MKISVVTVCYNHASFLEDTIKSVLSQNHPDVEYIVIDGGSTDGSVDIIKKFSERLDYWVSEPDNGQTDALKKGFAQATGEVFCWINSDDELEPGALAEVSEFFESHPEAKIVNGDHIKMDEKGVPVEMHREIPFNRFIWNYTYNYTAQTSTFWMRSLYEEVGGMDTDYDMAMDTDLFSRMSASNHIYKTKRVWSRFRLHGEQKTQNFQDRASIERKKILVRYTGEQTKLQEYIFRKVAWYLRISWKLITGCYFARLPASKQGALKWE